MILKEELTYWCDCGDCQYGPNNENDPDECASVRETDGLVMADNAIGCGINPKDN